MDGRSIADCFIKAALYMIQPYGSRTIIDGNIDLLVAASHLNRRNRQKDTFNSASKRDRRIGNCFANCRNNCFFIDDFLIVHPAGLYSLYSKHIQSCLKKFSDNKAYFMISDFQSRVDFLSTHRLSSLLYNYYIIIS